MKNPFGKLFIQLNVRYDVCLSKCELIQVFPLSSLDLLFHFHLTPFSAYNCVRCSIYFFDSKSIILFNIFTSLSNSAAWIGSCVRNLQRIANDTFYMANVVMVDAKESNLNVINLFISYLKFKEIHSNIYKTFNFWFYIQMTSPFFILILSVLVLFTETTSFREPSMQ